MALMQLLGSVYQHTTFYVGFVDICSNATINISLSAVGGIEEDILASFGKFKILQHVKWNDIRKHDHT